MTKVKFATKVSKEILSELRGYSNEAKRTISDIVDDALRDHLQSVRVRPAFKEAVAEVIEEHREALKRLAK